MLEMEVKPLRDPDLTLLQLVAVNQLWMTGVLQTIHRQLLPHLHRWPEVAQPQVHLVTMTGVQRLILGHLEAVVNRQLQKQVRVHLLRPEVMTGVQRLMLGPVVRLPSLVLPLVPANQTTGEVRAPPALVHVLSALERVAAEEEVGRALR